MNIWATHVSMPTYWTAGNGWNLVLPPITTIRDLNQKISDAGVTANTIEKLGVFVHGGQQGNPMAGVINLSYAISVTSALNCEADFRTLSNYLRPGGKLIFYSCTAAAGVRGDALLSAISNFMGAQEVIGFITYLFGPGQSTSGATTAGNVQDTLATIEVGSAVRLPMAGEFSPTTKVARGGNIVKTPSYREIWNEVLRCYSPASGVPNSFVNRVYEEYLAQSEINPNRIMIRNQAVVDAYGHAHGMYSYQQEELSQAFSRGEHSQFYRDYGLRLHPSTDIVSFYARRYLDQ
jgi:hypothetical protein